MAAQAMAVAMEEQAGFVVNIDHNLICENDKAKMQLLRSMFPNVKQAPTSRAHMS